MNLYDVGWNDFFRHNFEQYKEKGYLPARIAQQQREIYRVFCEHGELDARVSGRFSHSALCRSDFPAIGDWVAASVQPDENKAIIHAVLPRKSSFSRKAVLAGGPKYGPGKTEKQTLAANIDTVFLVTDFDSDFNPSRIERYITITWDSGAIPVIILNKSDLCSDVQKRIEEIETIALGVPVYPVSAINNDGLDALEEHLTAGKTSAFLGSSGVGKSTIINCLLGEERLKTNEVRQSDGRGRHTTVHREMIMLPQGGIVIDTPGLRELELWDDQKGLSRTFEDIEILAQGCRYNDCRHQNEPGCAVQQAIADGNLGSKLFKNYQKLQKELALHELRKDQRARLTEKKWKKIAILRKNLKKHRRKP